MSQPWTAVLADLGVATGDILFVHSSMDWIGGDVTEAVALIEALVGAVGTTGTLVMPSYTWRGSNPGRPPDGAVVDLRSTPCVVGLMPEIFRRWPKVIRSTSYWVPVCALGHQAVPLTIGQERVVHPFGPDATFRRLSDAGARMVGIGASLNTSSVAHLPDYDLAGLYRISPFTNLPAEGTVIDLDGKCLRTSTYLVRPDVMSCYAPSALFEHSAVLKAQLISFRYRKALCFSYPIELYHQEGTVIGRQCLSANELPPWITKWTQPPERSA